MQIGSVVWEEFYHIHTYIAYIHTYIHTHIHTHGIALSIRVTLNTKPASQVLIKSIDVDSLLRLQHHKAESALIQ